MACINKKGSSKIGLNFLTRRIWLWAIGKGNTLTASHIIWVETIIADKEFRDMKQGVTEWKLNPRLFDKSAKQLGPFQVDLFVSRLNFQMLPYFSFS